jgi:hypothetical protein
MSMASRKNDAVAGQTDPTLKPVSKGGTGSRRTGSAK